ISYEYTHRLHQASFPTRRSSDLLEDPGLLLGVAGLRAEALLGLRHHVVAQVLPGPLGGGLEQVGRLGGAGAGGGDLLGHLGRGLAEHLGLGTGTVELPEIDHPSSFLRSSRLMRSSIMSRNSWARS